MTTKKRQESVSAFYRKIFERDHQDIDIKEEWLTMLKFNLYLDCMPLDGLPSLHDDEKHAIELLISRHGKLRFPEEQIKKVLGEASLDYQRVMCKLVWLKSLPTFLIFQVLREASLDYQRVMCKLVWLKGLPTFLKFQVEQSYESEISNLEKYSVKIQTGMQYFQETKRMLHWNILYVYPEIYDAVCRIVEYSEQVSKMSLFASNYGKSMSLDEFETQQVQASLTTTKFLKVEWLEHIIHAVRMCLRDIGKGCFDLNQRIPEIYDVIKLKRFVYLKIHIMQTALRELVNSSMDEYLDMLENPTVSTLMVPSDYVWGDNLLESPFTPSMSPIFNIELQMNELGACFSTELNAFEKVIIERLDDSLSQCHRIKQAQTSLLPGLKFPPELFLSSTGLLSDEVRRIRSRLSLAYRQSVIPLQAYAKEFNRYLELYSLEIPEFIKNINQEFQATADLQEKITFHLASTESVATNIPNDITIGPFKVNTRILKLHLIEKLENITSGLLTMLTERLKCKLSVTMFDYSEMRRMLKDDPANIEGIFEVREFMETVPSRVASLTEKVQLLKLEYDVLESFRWNIPDEDFHMKWNCIGYPLKIEQQMIETSNRLTELTEEFLQLQLIDEASLSDKIDMISRYLTDISRQTDTNIVHEIAIDVKRVWKTMKDCQGQSILFNDRRRLFNMPPTEFNERINSLENQLEPYKMLWCTASDWQKSREGWLENPLINIDAEQVDAKVDEMHKAALRTIKAFQHQTKLLSIAVDMSDQIDEFMPYVSLIKSLRHPGMKPKHFEDLSARTGIQMSLTPALTLKGLLALGIVAFKDEVSDVADTAAKEYTIEAALDKMIDDWADLKMDIIEYKNTGTYIMKIADEILIMLDEHILNTQQIGFGPFRAAFEGTIAKLEEKLKLTQEVLYQWIDVQKSWMYLEAIFTSEDISRQLPVEAKKYNTMERNWRRIMKHAKDFPQILETCPDKSLLESLKECASLLEIVQRGLSDYLETKRTVFPRFFFLSDDELLEILAQTKNVRAVQPHLSKCFENMKQLQFEEDLQITKMYSSDNEEVSLRPAIYPAGNVENWLGQVEISMRNTLKEIIGDALAVVETTEREIWVYMWPGQVVICASQTYWTARVEDAIFHGSLKEYYTVMLNQLQNLRELMKSDPSHVQRLMLEALIIIEVHARDVVERLVEENVNTVNDFNWISQLRYYWVENVDLKIRSVNAEFPYGYEYLGNNGRLVITPLTERCYLTLTGALHLKFGGAPAGPAGTGKTETTKDLAKAFAIQCVVFNCSDQLDFISMGKFFKGLASAGAWACFDEFNRIDIEVLSVIAQQILTIQRAQQMRADRFSFEGSDIQLKFMCAIFITMNPGYAGRTELPDNLKALFRPVAMMVPNYSLIAEISLFSYGFSEAKDLAIKITATFKLSSEQLSTQDHYDFGMRAVKSVIAFAGKLKREQRNLNESQICLRALMDVNVPKFFRDDLKLFQGILSDLFPGVNAVEADLTVLKEGIHKIMQAMGLKIVADHVHKVIQLYETTTVRHGLMLVGETGSGKTKCYEILRDACSYIKGELQSDGNPFVAVHTFVINPKAISLPRLFGEFDNDTHEWSDGILPHVIRAGTISNLSEKLWYVFDGPVDAIWIENMNTLLDDNKKLCLTSGEIIKLQSTQTIIFEVGDLRVASPATVSRCGMVYLEAGLIGFDALMDSWIEAMPEGIEEFAPTVSELSYQLLPTGLELLRRSMSEIVTTVNSTMVQSYINLINYRFGSSMALGGGRISLSSSSSDKIHELLEPWVVFAVVWSLGGSCDHSGRRIFDVWLRRMQNEHGHKLKVPQEGLVYDYRLHEGGLQNPASNEYDPPRWVRWIDDNIPFTITPGIQFSDIEVPTLDSVRNAALIEYLLQNENNVLCVGPTGSGKTLTISSKLAKSMPKKFLCDFITFSAKTSASKTQELVDSKLEKKRAGVYGAAVLKRQVFFIDDLNMPAVEPYGAQPPLELLRQLLDSGGWYDSQEIGSFRQMIDVNILGAMGPPGGGRNRIDNRVLRHFHFIAFPSMENEAKQNIFGAILEPWLIRSPNCFIFFDKLLAATISVFEIVSKALLPTPDKSHYTFNLRDLARIFQGILMAEPDKIYEKEDLAALWYHENSRIMGDRLVNAGDLKWFNDTLWASLMDHFGEMSKESVLGNGPLFYGDFCDSSGQYQRITDTSKMENTLLQLMDEYNHSSNRPLKLVLFEEAMSHVCRISRILRQPRGNALLLGMGGSGRQSLTKLSAFVGDLISFQIESRRNYTLSDWHDDIKSIMLKAGLSNRSIAFLFSDTQIKDDSYLEDIHNILNSGDVPNIYQADELDKIFQAMRAAVQEAGLQVNKTNLYNAFLRKVRNNLHIVLAMSPIGEAFRGYIRQFPAIINCCVIDWFHPWSEQALQSVALRFVAELEDKQMTDKVLSSIVLTCQFMHSSAIEACEEFLQILNRRNYVTPASYLEMLSNYGKLLRERKTELSSGISRLSGGLGKLSSTEIEVKEMQQLLIKMKPELEAAAVATASMIERIQIDTLAAEETKSAAEKQENEAATLKMQNEEIKNEAEADLSHVKPMLQAAEASLKALNKSDITEVKAMKRPPVGVVLVIEAMCIVKDIKPLKLPGKMPGEKILDYWSPGSQLLSDAGHFLHDLENFDKSQITEEMINKLKHYIENPAFQPQVIMQVSKACYSLCLWLHAMYNYYFVNQKVAPKMLALKNAEVALAETEHQLRVAMEKLLEVEEGIKSLESLLSIEENKRRRLEEEKQLCEDRMLRAVRLIDGLGDEQKRWILRVDEIQSDYENCVGDCLIASGAIAYWAPFTDAYRSHLLAAWQQILGDKVPHSLDCSPTAILGDSVKIRKWQIDGLPRDTFSVENAVLVDHSSRWPLFIDPQSQANKWIKKTGKITGLSVVRITDKDLVRVIENCVRFGRACLIENINFELDSALDSVLSKSFIYQAGQKSIKVGDNIVPYHDQFRLYITTKLANPHYSPEIFVKVLIVNFALTVSGLHDQMLSLAVMQERPDLEATRSDLILSCAQMKNDLKDIEDRILDRLSSSEGSAVDDIDLINTLEASKFKSEEIKVKVAAAESTQIDIDATRSLYSPVANRAQILFFSIDDLRLIDFMYQYSLEWFISIFINSVASTEKSNDVDKRVNLINENFTFSLFSNVCRSLFEKHKLHLAFLICARIRINSNTIDPAEWRHLLAGGSPSREIPNPANSWVSSRAWNGIRSLESLNRFVSFSDEFSKNLTSYRNIFDAHQPESNQSYFEKLELDDFQRLLILKCLRPDRLMNAIQLYVTKYLGKHFVEPQTTELSVVYNESSPVIPLVFILSSGTDPAAELYKYAEKVGMGKKLQTISLGQGQGPRAELMLQQSLESGNWVFFQNCHLAPSWMPKLEALIESFPDDTHRDFRLWLTSTPTLIFPASILEKSVKLTVEPPRGIKANMLRAYVSQVAEMHDLFTNEHPKIPNFKSLLFSLCLFHSVLLERRKFGPLGFNIPYEFSDGDLKISMSQLKMFIMEYPEIPFEVLTYTAGHINYGGRITDDWDRRCVLTILHDYYRKEALVSGYEFDLEGLYRQIPTDVPESCTLISYLEYVRSLPLNDTPSIFGLHSNANISYASAEAYYCLDTLLELQPKESGNSAVDTDSTVNSLVENILSVIPNTFDIDAIQTRHPIIYEESLNTVLQQEAKRYNGLLTVLSRSLVDLSKALRGQTTMTEVLELISESLFNNKVPKLWQDRGYPSLKPLGAWTTDLVDRLNFMGKWDISGIPPAFWISGFFFPQAFLTGTMQNFARKHHVSIDKLEFTYQVLNNIPTSRPVDGNVIYGLFLEGCRWDGKHLEESQSKELHTEMKPILLLPKENRKLSDRGYYDCPVYKTLTRSGTLSTTGHSTNFVLSMEIPSSKSQAHWIKRGVALMCALDY